LSLFRKSKKETFRFFFATDVHGSDRCFRKFLAAAEAYKAQALILGGDIAGKAIVPIAAEGGGRYRHRFGGEETVIDKSELDELTARIAFNGLYPRICETAEMQRMVEDKNYVEQLFEAVISEQVSGWCKLAAERLPDSVALVITPGNDDPRSLDPVLEAAPRVMFTELEIADVGPIGLASIGNTNRTPWNTEREYEETELAEQIDRMLEGNSGKPLMFNFHCPPYASGLDTVAELDADFTPVIRHGVVSEVPVGSTAVRDAILEYSPTVALHGHIHECQGAQRIGETMCLNPGSDYASGVLKGAIVDVDDAGEYVDHLFTSG
jgi:Icc-related predicted phosphoesterase